MTKRAKAQTCRSRKAASVCRESNPVPTPTPEEENWGKLETILSLLKEDIETTCTARDHLLGLKAALNARNF